LVVRFVRAEGEERLLHFMSDWGIPNSSESADMGISDERLDDLLAMQQHFQRLLSQGDAAQDIDWAARARVSIRKRAGGRPTLLLRPQTLFGFMTIEAALLLIGDTGIVRCRYCGPPFLVGPANGRHSHARYCTPRCR